MPTTYSWWNIRSYLKFNVNSSPPPTNTEERDETDLNQVTFNGTRWTNPPGPLFPTTYDKYEFAPLANFDSDNERNNTTWGKGLRGTGKITINRSSGDNATPFSNNDFSVDFWIYPESGGGTAIRLFNNDDSNYYYDLDCSGSNVRWIEKRYNSTSHNILLDSGTLSYSDPWYHVRLEHINGTYKLYTDASLQDTASGSFPGGSDKATINLTNRIDIASVYVVPGSPTNYDTSTRDFEGHIDEVILRIDQNGELADSYNPLALPTAELKPYIVGAMSSAVNTNCSGSGTVIRGGSANLNSDFQLNENSGYIISGEASLNVESQVTSSAKLEPGFFGTLNTKFEILPSAGNIVGFPDIRGDTEYVDDDYAGDEYTLNARIYVEEGYGEGGYFDFEYVPVFDRQMRQDFNWDTQTDFLGGYKVGAEADIISTSESSLQGGLLFDESVNLDSETQSTFSGGRIRQADTDLASDFTTTSLGGNSITAQGTFLATTQFSPIGIVEIVPEANILADAQIDITGGYTVFSGSLNLGSEGDLTITFDSGTSAGVIIDNSSSIASDYAVTATSTNIIDGANNFASDFVLSETAGYLHDGQGALVSEAIWTPTLPSIIDANQMYGVASFATNFGSNVLYSGQADLQAQLVFNPEALRIPIAEPYRTYTVKTETRTYTIEQESRVFDVKSETRINNITTESRVYLVPSETRTLEVLPDLTIRRIAGRRVGERV